MSSSRRFTTFAPAAATSVPGASHSPRSTGSRELVIVTTTSPAAASRWLSPGSAPTLARRRPRASPPFGSRRPRARWWGQRRECTQPASRPGGRIRSLRACARRPSRDGARRRRSPRRFGAVPSRSASITATSSELSESKRHTTNVAPFACRRIELPAGETEPAVGGGHVRERALRQAKPAARRDLDLSRAIRRKHASMASTAAPGSTSSSTSDSLR